MGGTQCSELARQLLPVPASTALPAGGGAHRGVSWKLVHHRICKRGSCHNSSVRHCCSNNDSYCGNDHRSPTSSGYITSKDCKDHNQHTSTYINSSFRSLWPDQLPSCAPLGHSPGAGSQRVGASRDDPRDQSHVHRERNRRGCGAPRLQASAWDMGCG